MQAAAAEAEEKEKEKSEKKKAAKGGKGKKEEEKGEDLVADFELSDDDEGEAYEMGSGSEEGSDEMEKDD